MARPRKPEAPAPAPEEGLAERPLRYAYEYTPEVAALLEEFNGKFYVVSDFGSRCRVCWEEQVHWRKGRSMELHAQAVYDFTVGRMNDLVRVGGTEENPEFANKADAWLNHPLRRQYERVVFDPGGRPDAERGDGCRNLWRGFAYEDKAGDCSLYLGHLRENVCDGDPAKYAYLVGWMAYAVRNPGEQGHVAVVVYGDKGVGKNVFAEGFAALWGQHSLVVSDQQRVTRNFNAHLQDKCVLVADEAYYAGSRSSEGVLKALITGGTLTIERKGVDAVTCPNFLRLIMIGNEPHQVRASEDERRYLVMRCSDRRRGDTGFFAALMAQLDGGGYSALLHHLLHEVDLEGFEVRTAPHTDELREQMGASLRGAEDAWFECLVSGRAPGTLRREGTVDMEVSELADWAVRHKPREWGRVNARHVGRLFGAAHRGMNFSASQLGPRGEQVRKKEIPCLRTSRELWDRLRFHGPWHQVKGWETEDWEAIEWAVSPR